MSLSKEQAESLMRLSEHPDGRAFLKQMADDFDKAMRTLLYAKAEDLATAQGHARALHEQLKKLEDAQKLRNKS